MTIYVIIGIILILVIAVIVILNLPSFGRPPQGARLERVKKSVNYKNGEFKNELPTRIMTGNKGSFQVWKEFLFGKKGNVRPSEPVPSIKTDLNTLLLQEDLLVWFGHSSLMFHLSGKRVLVDPVLDMASAVPFINRPFKGTDIYKPEDVPDIDYLIITHDHWDHLDYGTVTKLKDRVKKVICPLGVGEYFEYWGFKPEQLVELDWYESAALDDGFKIHCFPSRHFSGRGLKRNETLWASFVFESPARKIYIAGDGGYDGRFKKIGEKFPKMDLAILENGQYNEDWNQIHLMPRELGIAAKEINAKAIMTVHHLKFVLSYHDWDEPLKNEKEAAKKYGFPLIAPTIGEIIYLKDKIE